MKQALDVYTKYLKDNAKRGNPAIECSWPITLKDTESSESYIELALVKHRRNSIGHRHEEVKARQECFLRFQSSISEMTKGMEMISLKKLCEPLPNRTPLKVLVDGAPGVGKTTLCKKLYNDWAYGRLLTNYDLVVLVNLRNKDISDASSVDQLFYHDSKEVKRNVTEYIKKTSGNGLLLIFDGFDELSHTKRNESSLFLCILRGDILCNCSVIVTSRPYASQSVHELQSVKRHVEILGFTEAQIEMCIEQTISDSLENVSEMEKKAIQEKISKERTSDLCKQLQERLDLASLCRIPLNCSIMLFVYLQENYHLPKTLTVLYELLIFHVFKRYAKRHGYKWREMKNLDDLPCTPTFCVRCCFKALCKLAYDGIIADKHVFYTEDIDKAFSEMKQCDTIVTKEEQLLDLMSAAKSFSTTVSPLIYNFNHLTIQEFLAARYIAKHYSLPPNTFFTKYLENDHYSLMLRFLSGITKMNFENAMDVVESYLEKKGRLGFCFVCCLLYESDQVSVCRAVADIRYPTKNADMSFEVGYQYSFECLSLANLIIHSNCQWKNLELDGNHLKALHKILVESKSPVDECYFEQLSVDIDMDSLPYLKLLGEISAYYRNITINIHLTAKECDKASMTPITTGRKLDNLKIKCADHLKIIARNRIFPQLVSLMLMALQTDDPEASPRSLELKIKHIEGDWLEKTRRDLVEMLAKNHFLNSFQLQLVKFGPEILDSLAEGLAKNTSLSTLIVGDFISSLDVRILFKILAKYSEDIKISSLHINIKADGKHTKYDLTTTYFDTLTNSNLHQVTTLDRVTFHLGTRTELVCCRDGSKFVQLTGLCSFSTAQMTPKKVDTSTRSQIQCYLSPIPECSLKPQQYSRNYWEQKQTSSQNRYSRTSRISVQTSRQKDKSRMVFRRSTDQPKVFEQTAILGRKIQPTTRRFSVSVPCTENLQKRPATQSHRLLQRRNTIPGSEVDRHTVQSLTKRYAAEWQQHSQRPNTQAFFRRWH